MRTSWCGGEEEGWRLNDGYDIVCCLSGTKRLMLDLPIEEGGVRQWSDSSVEKGNQDTAVLMVYLELLWVLYTAHSITLVNPLAKG